VDKAVFISTPWPPLTLPLQDAWQGCVTAGGGKDDFQVSTSVNGPWTNTTHRMSTDNNATVIVKPQVTGTYAYLRYAPNTFPQARRVCHIDMF
jgi:hypothetical protein